MLIGELSGSEKLSMFSRVFSGVIAVMFIGSAASGSAQTIWSGPDVVFAKAAFADPMDAANQDRLTANVAITRGNVQGIYNAVAENSYASNSSPSDTEWALGKTSDIGSLSFADWRTTANNNPPSLVGQDMVLHLITDDIYIDLEFTAWGIGGASGGNFSYIRTSAIPEPGTLGMVTAWAIPIVLCRRRRGKRQ